MGYFFEVVEEEPIPEDYTNFEGGDVEEKMAVVVYGDAIIDPGAVTVAWVSFFLNDLCCS